MKTTIIIFCSAFFLFFSVSQNSFAGKHKSPEKNVLEMGERPGSPNGPKPIPEPPYDPCKGNVCD